MFENAKKWFDRISYPRLTETEDWIVALEVRNGFRSIYPEMKEVGIDQMAEWFDKFLINGDSIFGDLYDLGEITKHHKPLVDLNIKELGMLAVMASTTPSISTEFCSMLNVAYTFNKKVVDPKLKAYGQLMLYSQIEDIFTEKLSDKTMLEDKVISDIANRRMDIGIPKRGFLSIDMSCSNEELVKAFKGWLKESRSKSGVKVKKDIRLSYNDWNHYKVLGMFDLNMWCHINNTVLTYGEQIEILFPNSDVDDDNYRNTHIPRMTRVFDESTMDQLKSNTYMATKL